MNYNEAKIKMDTIRQNFKCKGELIFSCAIQNVVDYGTRIFTKEYVDDWLNKIDVKHNGAEAQGKYLMIGREFEKDIAKCTAAISKIEPINFLMYVQREFWFYNGPDDISYDRAIELLRSVVGYSLQDKETDIAKEDLDYIGFEDGELCTLGYEDVFFNYDEEDY